MKSSNVKKVLSIVILCVVVAITVATVVLAIIPKKLYNPIPDNYYTVALWRDKKDRMFYADDNASEEDKEFMKDFEKLHAGTVRDNLLSTIFQTTGNKFEDRIVYQSKAENAMDTYANVSGSVCLVFHFVDEQYLQWNGKDATHAESTREDRKIAYTKMYLPVKDTDEFAETTVYLTGSDNKTNYSIKFLAHQGDLYDYLLDVAIDYV